MYNIEQILIRMCLSAYQPSIDCVLQMLDFHQYAVEANGLESAKLNITPCRPDCLPALFDFHCDSSKPFSSLLQSIIFYPTRREKLCLTVCPKSFKNTVIKYFSYFILTTSNSL